MGRDLLVVVVAQAVGLLEALVTAGVPVDDVDHRGESAQHDGHLPVTLVVDLAGGGADRGQRRGFLDRRYVVGGVVDRRVADEIDVGADGCEQVDLPARVVADHFALHGVQLLRARHLLARDLLEAAFERLELLVLVKVQRQRGAERAVEDREFPILLVVDLAVAGDGDRHPADARQRHRVAHEPVAFLFGAGGVGRCERQRIASQRIEQQRVAQQRVAAGELQQQRILRQQRAAQRVEPKQRAVNGRAQ